MTEFLKLHFRNGHHTIESHPFLPAESVVDEGNAPLVYHGDIVDNLSWCQPPVNPNKWIITENSFAYLPRVDITHLFVGTFPPISVTFGLQQQLPFFYGSMDNLLWQLLPHVCTEAHVGSDFFDFYNVGVTDVLRKARRIRFGGSDNDILPFETNDIHELLLTYPTITHLYFTSDGTKNSAFSWTHDQLSQFDALPSKGIIRTDGFVAIPTLDRTIQFRFLYSPSPYANMQIYGDSKTHFYQQLSHHWALNNDELTNKQRAQLLLPNYEHIDDGTWLYRLYQWAHTLRDINGLVRNDLFTRIVDAQLFV